MTATETAAGTTGRRSNPLVFLIVMVLALAGTVLLLLAYLDDDADHVQQTDIGEVETGPGSPID